MTSSWSQTHINPILVPAPASPPSPFDIGSYIGVGVTVGVLATLMLLIGYYIIHKNNKSKKQQYLTRNQIYLGPYSEPKKHDNTQYMPKNPLIHGRNSGIIDPVTSSSSSLSPTSSDLSFSNRNMFAPVGIRR